MKNHVKMYRKKTEKVHAVQLTAATVNEAARWCGGKAVEERDPFDDEKITMGLNIPTLEGVVRASDGDYIVQSWEGGFKVMPSGEFENIYEIPTRD